MPERPLIAVSITEGRAVRDLFDNGLLDFLRGSGFDVSVFTEAATVPDFVARWRGPGVEFLPFLPCASTLWQGRAHRVRRRLARSAALPAWLKVEERLLYPPRAEYLDAFRRRRPSLLLTTHAHSGGEAQLISAAKRLGIPTLGLVRSWDNVFKGLRSRPRHLAVWNEVNRREVVELEGYRPRDVSVVGSPQFDPYFEPGSAWTREKLAAELGLDPARPIILFATLGYFIPGLDETCWMDALLAALDAGELPGRPQVILRLHPWSRLEHFSRHARHPDVRVSRVDRYWPGLTWYMDRGDVALMANILRHSDVVVTPGSTITLEAAIFDRPTLVPIFHPYQPQRAREYFDAWQLGMHFGRIEKLDLAPILRRQEEFVPALRRALAEPGWYREARARLVADYAHFKDGRATERLAGLAARLAEAGS